jgi:hypothetical protein
MLQQAARHPHGRREEQGGQRQQQRPAERGPSGPEPARQSRAQQDRHVQPVAQVDRPREGERQDGHADRGGDDGRGVPPRPLGGGAGRRGPGGEADGRAEQHDPGTEVIATGERRECGDRQQHRQVADGRRPQPLPCPHAQTLPPPHRPARMSSMVVTVYHVGRPA